ncbi:MAG: electron transfer flavoprotein subunit alpha/FixB family protein [Hyphomicrobium sp.]
MSETKRVDPRRAYTITPDGIRRIVLGDMGLGSTSIETLATGMPQKTKARRLHQEPDQWYMAVAHSERGALDGHARQAIAAAAILATPSTGVVAVVLGPLTEDAAEIGADKIAVLENLDARHFQPDRELAAVQALIAKYRPKYIFIPDKIDCDGDLGRRLIASQSDTGAVHVVELDTTHASIIWSRGGGLASAPLPRFILLDAGAVETTLPFVGEGERVAVEDSVRAATSMEEACRDLGLEETDATEISLEEADFVVSAGNGVHNVQTLNILARALGAVVGASRVAVDDGKFTRGQQIGATGKTVTASTYVAVGISGAVQHLQGIKDCRHVIAINRDASAPIAKRADLTVVGDAEEVMQALLAQIEHDRRTNTQSGAA